MKLNNAILVPLARSGSCGHESKDGEADEVLQGANDSAKKLQGSGAVSRKNMDR